jgi:hypothetical protein
VALKASRAAAMSRFCSQASPKADLAISEPIPDRAPSSLTNPLWRRVPLGKDRRMSSTGWPRRLRVAALLCAGVSVLPHCADKVGPVLQNNSSLVLSNIAVMDVSEHGAVITWQTNEPATSGIEYGPSTSQQTTIPLFAMATMHTVTLAGLDAATVYHFRVNAKDASGFSVISDDQTFTTLGTSTPHNDGGPIVEGPGDAGTSCTPSCMGKQCGSDGCHGSCGSCGAPQTCGGGGTPGACGTPSHSCGMQLNDAPVAFCETFDQPSPITNRSGEMNGTLWGVQRMTGDWNYGRPEAWANATLDLCGTSVPVKAESDIRICNGAMREVTNDNLPGTFEGGTVTALTMYSKQPFDFAGRTGTVSFDVTNDSAGSHAAWPEFWMTDQPVPAPFMHFGGFAHPRNGLAVRMHAAVGPGQWGVCPNGNNLDKPRWTVGSAAVFRNYVMDDTDGCFNTGACAQTGLSVTLFDCVTEDVAGPNGGFNHVELRISQNLIQVYATNAGETSLHHIADVTGTNLTFTQGVIWIDDVHYNADKGDPNRPSQRNHTFAWDNIAFDGPLLARHLSFDVLDSMVPLNEGTGGTLLGWDANPMSVQTLTTLPMTAANISSASGALLLFNFWTEAQPPFTFEYSINGHAHTQAWPYPDNMSFAIRTLAIPVALNELVAGANTITLTAQGGVYTEWTHVNIALLDAAGVVQPVLTP